MERRPSLRWKLPEILESERITAYRLATTLRPHGIGQNTVYRWVREPQESIKLDTLALVLWGLQQITGRRFEVGVIEYVG